MPNETNESDLDKQLLEGMLNDFLKEAEELLDQLNLNLIQLETAPDDEVLLGDIKRNVHTLKGSSAFVELNDISRVAALMETKAQEAIKGDYEMSAGVIDLFYKGLDMLTELLAASDPTNTEAESIDIELLIAQLEAIPDVQTSETEVDQPVTEVEAAHPSRESGSRSIQGDLSADFRELLNIYKQSYDQLSVLKHIVYSSIYLTDPESLAVLFSKQIDQHMSVERNAVWLVRRRTQVMEIARNGKLVPSDQRRVLEIESSEVLQRVVDEQLVVWPSSVMGVNEVFPKYQSPTLFPIKGRKKAYGFLILDPEEAAEMEVYQFIGQFAAMILKISKLHQQVEEQRAELDEMTAILFKQNTYLSSLYHVELELMTLSDPNEVSRVVADAVVNELEAISAVSFLVNEKGDLMEKTAQSGEIEDIGDLQLPLESDSLFAKAFQTGRMVTCQDYPDALTLGSNQFTSWIIFPFKGQERIQGVLVVEIEDLDLGDSISILMNFSGIVLDNLNLKRKVSHVSDK